MNNYQAWLETPGVVRIALAQVQGLVGGTLTTRYISTHGVTIDGIQYSPIIKGTISIDESLSLNYTSSISYGDIELANNNGEYDSWLEDIWSNKPIQIYVGAMPAPGTTSTISDFELIFSGLIDDVDSKSRGSLNLKIRDKLEKLNTSVSEALLGNYNPQGLTPYTNQYQNSLKPLCYGEVHNITPLLTDPALLEYMVNLEAVEQIIEVRDNGVPVAFTTSGTITIPPGSFRLLKTPIGTITCSVQGMKRTVNVTRDYTQDSVSNTYTNTARNIILSILKLTGQTLDYSEIDRVSFGPEEATLGTQAVGLYLTDRTNILAICQELAKNCGLVLCTTRLGEVRLVELSIPTEATIDFAKYVEANPDLYYYWSTDLSLHGVSKREYGYLHYYPFGLSEGRTITRFEITESDLLLNTLGISQRPEVVAGVKLGYAKNWTIQNNLTTAIPQQHKDMYATEWLESIQKDDTVKTNYLVSVEPTLESTYLIDKTQADAVAQKKLDLFKTRRKVLTMTCTAKFLSLQVGDAIKLTASRFGLNSGSFGRVVSTKPNWLRGTIEIGVLV
jgi:hypothetical protein